MPLEDLNFEYVRVNGNKVILIREIEMVLDHTSVILLKDKRLSLSTPGEVIYH